VDFSGDMGGIAVRNYGKISECYSEGDINAYGVIGGISGNNHNLILNSYSKMNLVGFGAGGIAGFNDGNSVIQNSYFAGMVPDSFSSGGIASHFDGEATLLSSYWDSDVSSVTHTTSNPFTFGYPEENFKRSTGEMKSRNNYVGWDFDDIWNIDNGNSYPELRMNTVQCGNGLCESGETMENCAIDCDTVSGQIQWETNLIEENNDVDIIISIPVCSENELLINVYEYDGIFGSTLVSEEPILVNCTEQGFARITWHAMYMNDGWLQGDPEYIFVVEMEGVSGSYSSKDSYYGILGVSKKEPISTTPISFEYLGSTGTTYTLDNGWFLKQGMKMVGNFDRKEGEDMVFFDFFGNIILWSSNGAGFEYVGSTQTSYTMDNGWFDKPDMRMVGDVNGDKLDEILFFDFFGNIHMWQSNGAGFEYVGSTQTSYTMDNGWFEKPNMKLLADVDGNGDDDLMFFDFAGNVHYWNSNGNSFEYVDSTLIGYTDFGHPYNRIVMDYNGDGRKDIGFLEFNSDSYYLNMWEFDGRTFYLGRILIYTLSLDVSIAETFNKKPKKFEVGNFDEDLEDEIILIYEDGFIKVIDVHTSGSGAYTTETLLVGGSLNTGYSDQNGWFRNMEMKFVGDVNADGIDDLILIDNFGTLIILKSIGVDLNYCGDTICQGVESYGNCYEDCSKDDMVARTCGNGLVDVYEDVTNCEDCRCGNIVNSIYCPLQCKCGNGYCEYEQGEGCERDCNLALLEYYLGYMNYYDATISHEPDIGRQWYNEVDSGDVPDRPGYVYGDGQLEPDECSGTPWNLYLDDGRVFTVYPEIREKSHYSYYYLSEGSHGHWRHSEGISTEVHNKNDLGDGFCILHAYQINGQDVNLATWISL